MTNDRQPIPEMQTFTPFPLRARGLVEQFDAAIKLYKQYFWVLLGWSAIVTSISILSSLVIGGLAGLFLAPLTIGSVICCVAAAVRGQSVEFKQCWRFTGPRYWPVLGLHLLSSFIGAALIAILIGIMVAITIGGIAAFGSSSGAVQIAMGIFAFLVFGTIGTIVSTVFLSWMGLVPIVVCMEDDKRGMPALRRAYEMLRGHWLRITTLMGLAGLAMIALLAILASTAAILVGLDNIRQMASGGGTTTAAILGIVGFGGSYTLLLMLWTPLYYLILTVFYLDVRVRQEALDLEWTAHATAPVASPAPSTLVSNPLAPLESFAPSSFAPDAYAPNTYSQTSPAEYSAPTPFTPATPTESAAPRYATVQLEESATPNETHHETPGAASTPAADNFAPDDFSPNDFSPDNFAPKDFIEGQPLPAVLPDENGVIAPPAPSTPQTNEQPRPQW